MDAKGLSPEREAEAAIEAAYQECANRAFVCHLGICGRETLAKHVAEAIAAAHERAIRMAAYKAKAHAHHALWGDFLDYQWDEKIEKFAMALCWRVHDSILSLISEPSNAE